MKDLAHKLITYDRVAVAKGQFVGPKSFSFIFSLSGPTIWSPLRGLESPDNKKDKRLGIISLYENSTMVDRYAAVIRQVLDNKEIIMASYYILFISYSFWQHAMTTQCVPLKR